MLKYSQFIKEDILNYAARKGEESLRRVDGDKDWPMKVLRDYGIHVIDRDGIELHFDELEYGTPKYQKIDRDYSLAITPDNVWIVTNKDKYPIGWLGDGMRYVNSQPDMIEFFIQEFAEYGLEAKRRLISQGLIM